MGERFSLVYRYSKDNGVTWTDISDAVDSRETKIIQSLCTNNFTSAKDSATFTLPATDLPVKSQLVQDLLGTDDLLFEIYIPSPVQVQWGSEDVEWDGDNVMWRGRSIGFTGYIDRSSVDLKSYPLPTSLTITAYDVSFLKLDEKVDQHVLLENKTVTEIVHTLLGMAGYSYDSSAIASGEEVTLEAFVIDKDKAKTYRQYIDDLLFEVGGYVLDFKPDGVARIFRLPWDDADGPVRVIGNPMNEEGIAIKSSWMQNDGVRLKWSTLSWSGADQVLWRDSIQRQIDSNGRLTGVQIQNGRYWPDGGEVVPSYMNYSAEMLDAPYLTRESRKKNEDLAIIMAKNVYAYIQATKGGNPYTFPVPAGYPVPADFQVSPYDFTTNPMIWPLKAWWLLYNNSGDEVDLQFFTVKGMALYRSKINTLETAGCSKPKEYESTYIYNASQAQRFLDFYWHFLQTSRFSMTWTEPLIDEDLGDVVQVTQKGMVYTQDAVIVAKTMKFINDRTPVITFSAVGVAVPVLANGVAQSDIPQGPIPPERGASTVYAEMASSPSYTLSQWQTFGTDGYQQTWSVTNDAEFRAGDIAVIRGVISDLDNTPITLYITVTSVGSGSINGVGRSVEYLLADEWDFDLPQTTAYRDLRDNTTITTISLKAKTGSSTVTPHWTCSGGNTAELADETQSPVVWASTADGKVVTLRIAATETSDEIVITMSDPNNNLPPVSKTITVTDQTEYGHNYGLLASPPTSASTPPILFVAGKPTDFYTNSTDGITYEYTTPPSTWTPSDSASRLTGGLKLLIDAGVNLSSISNANTVSFFRDIVAQTIFAETIKAVNGFFDSITVTGNSTFHGKISSSAFETTLEDPTPGVSYPLTLGNTKYWNSETYKNTLAGVFTSAGYYTVSGSFTTVRRKGANNLYFSNHLRLMEENTWTVPRTQRLKIANDDSKVGGVFYINNSSNYTRVNANSSVTVSLNKGDTIRFYAGYHQSEPMYGAYFKVYDIDSDYETIAFFDSNDACTQYSGYVQGTPISITYNGTTYTPTTLYKWGGMPSPSGSGITTSSSLVTILNEDGSINLSSERIQSISWTTASALTMLNSNGQTRTITTSMYYKTMSGTLTTQASQDGVVSTTIKPKADETYYLGVSGASWLESWIKKMMGNVNGDTSDVDDRATNAGYKVWRAVFN